jgi:hypothetical protein
MSLSSRNFGGDRNCNFAIESLIGGARRDNADGKPLGPVFGFMCPIGTVCVCHDRGCGRWMVFVEVGVRWDTQPVEDSESDWLDYAFVWVTAAAGRRSGSHVAQQAINHAQGQW